LGEDIVKTGDVFDQVATRTSDLHEVVENLGKVVELISKIAGHTDMLALNASIEAARAGVHGKSFAVVAEEVKSLSRQTSEATGTIKSQIRLLTTAFQEVIASVSDARAVVGRVVTQAAKVSEDFNRINANSSSISEQVRELSIIISQQREAIDLMANNMAVVKDKGEVNLSAVDQLVLQTDRSVGLIEDWRLRLADEDIQDKVILLAQADHLLWKKRLLDMAVGRSSMKSSDLTDHTLCRLGKWYYGQGSDGLRDLPAFQAIEEPHKRVHAHGIQAAKYFEQRMIDEGMREYAKLDAASRDVIADLQQLVSHARPIQQV
jgi:methyl-accepting chemotaxis protein